jgi:hypothetical protein
MAEESNEPMHEDDMPPNVVSPLEQMAIVTNETFLAFLRSGFKENHALALTMKALELSTMQQYYDSEDLQELDLDEDE